MNSKKVRAEKPLKLSVENLVQEFGCTPEAAAVLLDQIVKFTVDEMRKKNAVRRFNDAIKPTEFSRSVADQLAAAGPEMKTTSVPIDAHGSLDIRWTLDRADRTFAWLEVLNDLNSLASSEKVMKSPSALEFVQVMGLLASRAFLADSAKEVLQPVDALLPSADKVRAHSASQGGRRAGKTKLTEAQKKQIRREYSAATVAYGMKKALARKFSVSEDTIARVLNT